MSLVKQGESPDSAVQYMRGEVSTARHGQRGIRVFYRKRYDPVNKKTPDPFYFIKPFLSFGANQEQLLAAIGSLRLHHSAKHVEQEGFSFHIAHARKLGHIRGDVNLVIKAYPVECARVSEEEGEKRGEGFDVPMAGD